MAVTFLQNLSRGEAFACIRERKVKCCTCIDLVMVNVLYTVRRQMLRPRPVTFSKIDLFTYTIFPERLLR
ncbi:MAG: hypothetical protein A2W17_01375 [Planctomycetes bacterium RBG_16_41_13]|nr:MAG: hypothetical protein A2W17_01375 [Planctomycetes bacterium RBG_16_41_13]